MKTKIIAGHACIELENAALKVWITASTGPRILGLKLHGHENLLAVLPDVVETTPGGQHYHFRGGHRLWHAPEHPERTYVPDDEPVEVTSIAGGICATQAVEARTGIQKSIALSLPNDDAQVVVDHVLHNRTLWPIELAAWAITQFRPGGFAILPQPAADSGLLPNRRLALWPYTPIGSPYIHWGDRFIFVRAQMSQGKLKLGWANPDGWMGYWVDQTLFVKEASWSAGADYPDFGSSSECYCDARFIELESLGPKTLLEPGASLSHRETWNLYQNVRLVPDEATVTQWLEGQVHFSE